MSSSNRLLADPSIAAAVDTLNRLNGPDLSTVLLEVMRGRRPDASHVLDRHRDSRFCRPATVPLAAIRRVEDALLDACGEYAELVQLAPGVPLGTHVALGGSSQDRVVGTVRRTELAADPTIGLALEAASRRRDSRTRRDEMVCLATVQRVTRAQAFEGGLSFAHFTLVGMVTAGRDDGPWAFECRTAVDHAKAMVAGVQAAGGSDPEVTVRDVHGAGPAVAEAIREAVRSDARVELSVEPHSDAYYSSARFGLTAIVGGERLDVGDGGFVDWTAALLADRKERLCVSGIGVDRLALAPGKDDSPAA